MASVLLTVAGSALGNAILPGIGGPLLGSLGAWAGSSIDQTLFGSQTTVRGPRLDSLKVQDSAYGTGIPIIYGHVRMAGNVIWASDLMETLTEESAGGKGGGAGTTVARASYAIDCAIALGFGPVGRIVTIWADGKVIYSAGQWKPGIVSDAEFYLGSDTQDPSPVMQGALGSSNVPAYRGLAYVVLHRLQLGPFGNRLPNVSFEVEPDEPDLAPVLTGEIDPALVTLPDTALLPAGAPPVATQKRGEVINEVVTFGLQQSGFDFSFVAIRLDVSGKTPVEISRVVSSTMVMTADCIDFSYAPSPDGQKVALHAQFDDGSHSLRLVLFDVKAGSYGSLLSENYGLTDYHKQVGWLDAQHFILSDTVSAARGVRVYVAQGSTVVPYGFFGVWGSGSSSSRFPLKLSQYVPLSGGLLYAMTDHASAPNTLYVRSLYWQNGTLSVGSEVTLSSALGAFTGPYAAFLPLPGGEVLLARWNTTTLKAMTFMPSASSPAITRNWSSFSLPGNGNASVCIREGRLQVMQYPLLLGSYLLFDVAITDTGFSAGSNAAVTGSYSGTLDNFSPYYVGPSRLLVQAASSSGDYIRIALLERGISSTSLEAIASDLLDRAGYIPGDYDCTGLSARTVDGYVIDGPMPARHALEPLQVLEPFSLVESDGILKASLCDATITTTIALSETRATQEKSAVRPLSEQARGQELDVPREVVVDYLDPSRDFQRGSQRARRLASAAQKTEKLALPLVCDAHRAKQAAERQLYMMWAGRQRLTFSLSRAYGDLDPGDVISLAGQTLRLEEIKQQAQLLDMVAVPVTDSLFSGAAEAESGSGATRIDFAFVPGEAFLLDLPLLRTQDDQPGYYLAASGASGWKGGSLWRADDGVNYSRVTACDDAITCGVATSVLASGPADYPDRAHSVTVALLRGSLANCTDLELLNGANAALLGGEIIQFKTVTLNADGSYTLSHILRGRKGTESARSSHGLGERFILLQKTGLQFIPVASTARGRNSSFKCVTHGQDMAFAAVQTFSPSLATLRPYDPVHLAVSRNGSGDATFSWKRRARRDAEWLDGVDVPLDETAELYDIEILSGSTVVRTFSDVTVPYVTYSAAQQASDFGSTPASVAIRVMQKSALYGRGAPASAAL